MLNAYKRTLSYVGIFALAFVGIVGLAQTAKADAYDWRDARITISASVGDLTRSEARALRKLEANYEKAERKAWKDGVLTRKEYRQLRRLERRLDVAYYRQSNDDDRRWWAD